MDGFIKLKTRFSSPVLCGDMPVTLTMLCVILTFVLLIDKCTSSQDIHASTSADPKPNGYTLVRQYSDRHNGHNGRISPDEVKETIAKYRPHFDKFDTDHDGHLTKEEMTALLKSLRMDQLLPHLDEHFEKHKINGKDTFYIDFYNLLALITPDVMKEEYFVAFRGVDKNQDGYVSPDELRDWLSMIFEEKMTQKQFDEMCQEAQIKKDHSLNYAEFATIFSNPKFNVDEMFETITHYQAEFEKFDQHKTGKIGLKDLEHVLKALHHEKDMEKLKSKFDKEHGQITFRKFMQTIFPDIKRDDAWDAFGTFDLDGNGYISANEMAQAMQQKEEKAEKVMKDHDEDGDGQFNFKEFVDWMTDPKYNPPHDYH